MTDDTWSDVRFLTVYELALMMRISKMSAYRLVRTGELESIRVGRSYRIPEQAVISYMREAAFTPAGLASLEPGKPGGQRFKRQTGQAGSKQKTPGK
jgi:excisionase family DNA binding protein